MYVIYNYLVSFRIDHILKELFMCIRRVTNIKLSMEIHLNCVILHVKFPLEYLIDYTKIVYA